MCEIKNCVFKIPSINILNREFEETDDSGKFIQKHSIKIKLSIGKDRWARLVRTVKIVTRFCQCCLALNLIRTGFDTVWQSTDRGTDRLSTSLLALILPGFIGNVEQNLWHAKNILHAPPPFFDSQINIIFKNHIHRVWVLQFFQYTLIRLYYIFYITLLKKMITLPKIIKCFSTKLKSQGD